MGGTAVGLKDRLKETTGVTVEEILLPSDLTLSDMPPSTTTAASVPPALSVAPAPVRYDLLKLDGDGPEGGWLRKISELVRSPSCRLRVVMTSL